MTRIEATPRRPAWGILLLVAIFVAGTLTGAGIHHLVIRMVHSGDRPPPPPDIMPLDGLDLSPQQLRQARTIGERHRPEFEALRREIAPRGREIGEQMERELFEILTPVQRERHQRLKAQWQKRPRPPHGPPPPH